MRTNARGTGFPLIGVRGGDPEIGELPNGSLPGMRAVASSPDMAEPV